MTDIDPAAVKAKHVGDGLEPVECEGCRAACLYCEGDHPWPCEPYRLADALATARDELDRIATPTTERIDYGHEPTSGNGACTICGRPNNDHETADV